MSFFQDIMPIFKKRTLPLLERYQEADGVYTFLFEKGDGVVWKAGQHGLFTITHKKLKNGIRPFSVASAPSESAIRITVGIGDSPSEFKQAMLELEQGMSMSMTGPVGSFYLKDDSPTLLIAGGVGVTPFRSILKHIEAEGGGRRQPVKLLYMDSGKSYLFKDELDAIADKTPVEVAYLDARDDLRQEIDTFIASHRADGKFFVSGPKSMVESVAAELKHKGIAKRNVKKDVFFGY